MKGYRILMLILFSMFMTQNSYAEKSMCEQIAAGAEGRANSILQDAAIMEELVNTRYALALRKFEKNKVGSRGGVGELFQLYAQAADEQTQFSRTFMPVAGVYETLENFAKSDACKESQSSRNWAIDIFNENFDAFNEGGVHHINQLNKVLNAIDDYYEKNALKFM